MVILNGKEVSDLIKEDLKKQVHDLYANRYKRVHLAIVQVGNDPASSVYVKNKIKSCEYIGIDYDVLNFPESITQNELIDRVRDLNRDQCITGILVQLPLPSHINEKVVLSAISVEKDVDGFREANIGNLVLGNNCVVSCTPAGVMRLLNYYNIDVAGKECVVVGRSNIVGKPMAMLFLQNDGTVTVCHSKTKDLKSICKRADILVCAIGRPKFFNHEYVKEGAVVIDVGIHRQENGKLCGDVNYEDVENIVSTITPVPGGVGAMTVAMLMENCVRLALNDKSRFTQYVWVR